MAALTKPLGKLKKFVEKNPFEGVHEPTGIVKGVGKSLREDLAGKDTMKAMWEQFLSGETGNGHKETVMAEGKEYHVENGNAQKSEDTKRHDIDPGINYRREILHYRESAGNRESREIEQKVQEIVIELQRLINSSDTVIRAEFQQIAVEQAPAEVGKYHVHFFEWMLATIRSARIKVEDSGVWLAAMSGKKNKKNGGMLLDAQRKGNTSVSMSNERSVATQSG